MIEATDIEIVSKPGEPVRLILRSHGSALQATLAPALFERIFDRIGQAVALSEAKGLGAMDESWEL